MPYSNNKFFDNITIYSEQKAKENCKVKAVNKPQEDLISQNT